MIARTKPNSVKSRPASLGRKEIGTKTAISVTVVAITAKNTCRVPITAAARGAIPSARRDWMFSVTTMASSTTRPVASTIASSVMRFTEKPSSQTAANDPISAMGIVTAGISVAPMRPKKTQMTMTTMTRATTREISTS